MKQLSPSTNACARAEPVAFLILPRQHGMNVARIAKRSQQISMLAKEKSAYGGDYLKLVPVVGMEDLCRPMHLVLRSTRAKGEWSFRRPRNEALINRIVDKFAVIYGVRVVSMANVGNHLHLQIKLSNRFGYRPFIRAVTSAIAMAVTGVNRWTKNQENAPGQRTRKKREKFWDYRPYTRVVERELVGEKCEAASRADPVSLTQLRRLLLVGFNDDDIVFEFVLEVRGQLAKDS